MFLVQGVNVQSAANIRTSRDATRTARSILRPVRVLTCCDFTFFYRKVFGI